MPSLKRKPSEGAKSRFEYIARQLFGELKKAQESLTDAITNLNLTGTFGEAKINDVKRLEATILCLPVAEVSYFESENDQDFQVKDVLLEDIEIFKHNSEFI